MTTMRYSHPDLPPISFELRSGHLPPGSYVASPSPVTPPSPGTPPGGKEGGRVSESEQAPELWTGNCAPGTKADGGKPRWDLLPWESVSSVVDVLTLGARKYAPDNWQQVPGARRRYFRAAIGHLTDWYRGEKLDKESGLPHLAHAACCVLFLLWFEANGYPPEQRDSGDEK